MIVLDTSVLAYAVGDPHPLKRPAQGLLTAVTSGRVRATTTVEVIQEFTHVRARRRSREQAVADGADFALMLAPLISADAADLHLGLEILGSTRVGCFDAVLAAVTIRRSAEGLVTADAAFSEVEDLRVIALGGTELARLI